jgi:hypothetical protein
MKILSPCVVSVAVLASFCAGLQAADSPKKASTIQVINNPDLSPMVEAGTSVTFTSGTDLSSMYRKIYAEKKVPQSAPPLIYQWQKNGNDIAGATKSYYTIPEVTFTNDVATYTLVLSGALEAQSAPVHLSVYTLIYSNSNGGALSTPIQGFTSGTYTACNVSGFDRYKTYMLFYGPNATSQTGPFQNTSGSSLLDLTTCTNLNGTSLDTAILFQGNWASPPVLGCNDDDPGCGSNVKLSTTNNIALSTSSTANNTYRTTIFYKSSTLGGNANVTFRWYYHN